MIVCHSRKFVFFSFPKTGSESLRAMLAPHAEEPVGPCRAATRARPFYSHMSPAEARAAFAARGLDLGGYTTFTITRNPFARMVSIYEMVMAVDGIEKLRRRAGLPRRPFGAWLASTRPDGRGAGGRWHQRWRKYGTWSTRAWISGEDGAPLVAHVLRLEHLAHDLPPLLARLGLEPPQAIAHRNRRVTTDWRRYYDAESRALVEARYGGDLQTYGYRFDAG